MHRPYVVRLSDGSSPGHLADFGQALGRLGINLRGIGGAEWQGAGVVAVLVDDSQNGDLEAFLNREKYDWTFGDGVEIELNDEPGALGNAARRLADRGINIIIVLVSGGRGGRSLVTLGVPDGQGSDAEKALHELTLAHLACEDHHHEAAETAAAV
jgi:hypothetical protein